MTLIRRGCAICGAAHTACGGPTTTQPVDALVEGNKTVSRVQRYQNDKGHVFSMTPEDAEKLGGFTPVESEGKAVNGPPSDKARRSRSTKTNKPDVE